MTWNVLHVARVLKDATGIPVYGSQPQLWVAGTRLEYEIPSIGAEEQPASQHEVNRTPSSVRTFARYVACAAVAVWMLVWRLGQEG